MKYGMNVFKALAIIGVLDLGTISRSAQAFQVCSATDPETGACTSWYTPQSQGEDEDSGGQRNSQSPGTDSKCSRIGTTDQDYSPALIQNSQACGPTSIQTRNLLGYTQVESVRSCEALGDDEKRSYCGDDISAENCYLSKVTHLHAEVYQCSN